LKVAALSGKVFVGGRPNWTNDGLFTNIPVWSRHYPDVVAEDAAFRRPLAIPDAERVWFGRFVFPVAEWLKMIWLSGNGLAGERRRVSDALQHEPDG
jgi:hypothetical protein